MIVAIAVDSENKVNSVHFGDAAAFVLVDLKNESYEIKTRIENNLKTMDESHGSKTKGNAVLDLLKEQDVKVVVSQQFGKNIKIIGKQFVPVVSKNLSFDALITALYESYEILQNKINQNDFNVFRL